MKTTRKHFYLLAAAMLAVSLHSSAALAAFEDDLVAYWPLNENFGDLAGNHNGTLMGTNTVPSFTPAKFGGGIDLDGVDQFVQIDPTTESDFDFDMQNFSVSAWFRVDALTKNWQALIAKGEQARWRVHRRGGEDEFTWNGGEADVPNHDTPINDGLFHHFVGVSEQGVGVRMYQDGVLVATGPAPTNVNHLNDMPVMIGENPDARNRTWDGVIDDVAIWGRALTEAEVGAIWNGGTGNSIASLTGGDLVKGDVNGDGVVDMDDYNIIRDNFRLSPATREEGNLDFGRDVGLDDFREWKTAFEAAGGIGPANVPEPSTLTLLGVGALLMGVVLRRRSA